MSYWFLLLELRKLGQLNYILYKWLDHLVFLCGGESYCWLISLYDLNDCFGAIAYPANLAKT